MPTLQRIRCTILAVVSFVFLAAAALTLTLASQTAYANRQQGGKQKSKATGPENGFAWRHQAELSKNPEDISFTLALENGKSKFKQGEIVRLILSFASNSPKTYRMDGATYDRSGRLQMDRFHLDPEEGVTDPLFDYFHGSAGFMMGGIRTYPELEAKPHQIIYDLNEWFRFDKPGKYRLYLTSPRVSRIGVKGNDHPQLPDITSNTVEFEVLPSEREWTEKELRQAIQVLEAKDRKVDRRGACRVLRFLGSKEAAAEMVRRLGNSEDECNSDYYFGLIGSPHRDYVIEELETQLTSPTQPVSENYLSLLTKLVIASRYPNAQPVFTGNEKPQQEQWQQVLKLSEKIQQQYTERLATAIANKSGVAKAVSVNTLLGLKWEMGKLPQLSSVLTDLPRREQRTLLEYRWKQIADTSLLPTLRRLYEMPSNDDYETTEINSLALRRIYELSPEEGRRLILAEIAKPQPRVRMAVLGRLPDETLPGLDQALISHLEKAETEITSALVERYASPNILPRVRVLIEDQIGRLACSQQASLLAYCVRADAASGAAMIRRAVQARGPDQTRCYTNVLREVGKLHTDPELEKVAVEFLDDPDPEVVIDAAAMLGERGSAEAEEALWRRFEKWHQVWNGRERELQMDFHDHDNPIRLQRGLEQALRLALNHSPAWLMDAKKLERLRQLCITSEERKQVEHLIAEWQSEISIRFAPEENTWGRAEVAHYSFNSLSALKSKLAQFPKGTVFNWQPYNAGHLDEEKEKLFSELKPFLEERGMRLHR